MDMRKPLVAALSLVTIGALAIVAWLFIRMGETPPTHYKIGILHPTKVDIVTAKGFRDRMAELEQVEGNDVIYLYNGPAGRGEFLEEAAAALVKQGANLIFTSSTPATQAAQRATEGTSVAVVFGPVNNPIKAGVVENLRLPGANITGVTLPASGGKRLQWFREIAPSVQKVFVPFNPDDKSSVSTIEQAEKGAKEAGLVLMRRAVRNNDEITAALASIPEDAEAIFLPRDAMITSRIDDIKETALKRKLPLSVPGFIQVEAGALFSYGFFHYEVGRNAAKLADQILRGSKPGELPVETAQSFLFINLKTAEAIGLEIPDHVLRQAKHIIRE